MKRLFRFLLLAGLALALLAAGCAPRLSAVKERVAVSDQYGMPAAVPMPTMAPAATAVPPMEGARGLGYAGNAPALSAERKIILTTSLQLVVQETDKTVEAIKSLVAAQDGYIASANVWRQENLLQASLTVRVPADKLDLFLTQVRKLAVRIEREESSGQDVTEEYVDIQAQLTNLEATERELRTLLAEVREKTGKAEDVMSVFRELTNVRGEIDRLKGRMQYLDRLTAMATVNLSLSERQPEPIGRPGWQPLETLRRALSALVQAVKLGVDLLIWGVAFVLPLAVVPVVVIWLIWYLTRRRSRSRAATGGNG